MSLTFTLSPSILKDMVAVPFFSRFMVHGRILTRLSRKLTGMVSRTLSFSTLIVFVPRMTDTVSSFTEASLL